MNCKTCGQETPLIPLREGDIVEDSQGLSIVPGKYLCDLLDKTYGGPASEGNIRLVRIKFYEDHPSGASAAYTFIAYRSSVQLVHGHFHIAERL